MALSVKRSRSSRHILIASGNPGFQAKMARLLGTAPWKVSEAVGGAEALVRLEETDAGILLLDRHIHDLDYSELMSLIPSQYPDVEVALLDGDNGEVVFPECPMCQPVKDTCVSPAPPSPSARIPLRIPYLCAG